MAKKASSPKQDRDSASTPEENQPGESGQGASQPHRSQSLDTFEQDLGEVERIVRQLESGQLTLGESLKEYEQGVKRLKRCYAGLQSAQRRIELLTGVDAEGNPIVEDYEANALTLEEKQSSRGRRRGASNANQASKPNRTTSPGSTNVPRAASPAAPSSSAETFSGGEGDDNESMDDLGALF